MQARCSPDGDCQSQFWTPLKTHGRGNASTGSPGSAPVQQLQGQRLVLIYNNLSRYSPY